MHPADLTAILPFLVIAATSVVVMLLIAVTRSHRWTVLLTVAGLAAAFLSLFMSLPVAPRPVTSLLRIDRYALFYIGLIVAGAVVVTLFSYDYLEKQEGRREEFYVLLLVATLGAAVLAASSHFASFFLGLETLSVPLFVLNAYLPNRKRPLEAGIKYLVLAAASSSFLLFGMALIYAELGTMTFGRIGSLLAEDQPVQTPLLLPGAVMVLTGIGFKLSLVPFHLWTPDVYEGAPTPVTAFLSIGSKAGGFVVAIRLLSFVFAGAAVDWGILLGVLAVLSMVAGNLIALAQTSFKRMLAYSSIAHVGYMLIGLVANNEQGLSAMVFYIIVYGLMNLGAFAGAIMFSQETGSDNINDYAGLIRKRPWLAIAMSVCLLNLAGLPVPPAGFFAKVFIFWSGVELGSQLGWLMVVTALLTSVPAVYYYTRVVVKMVVRDPSEKVAAMPAERSLMPNGQIGPAAALAVCVAGIIAGSSVVNAFMGVSRDAVSPIVQVPEIGSLPSTLR